MRRILLAAFTAAAILAMAAPVQPAAAMTVASPVALGVAAADGGAVQQVRWYGWRPHRAWGWRHPYSGWHRYGYWAGRPYWGHPYWGRRWYPRVYWGWPRLWPGRFWHPWGCCWSP
jgi:hypothetical protein